ncbi:MAG: polysulfide reductase NrfD [Nitrospinae bacterium]|nr:polysulfide reductase NrfD [Nitrospinota bacterium]
MLALSEVKKGSNLYYGWVAGLSAVILLGVISYAVQMSNGFIVTSIRDQVSWGFYISNFTFLVGVAAAAVLLVLPAYIYHFKPIKEIVFLGEMMAITAICMCIMFVTVDLGHPERVWHMLPLFGSPNFPRSMLTWDVLALNGYLIINATVFFYIMYKLYEGADYDKIMPLVLLSIPWAVSIHTVTAFLYNGLGARPFWNASILAPRFLASAFCSGPALMIIVLQAMRKLAKVPIDNKAIFKLSELIAFTMAINIFLLGCEVFKEVYSDSIHLYSLKYLYFGLHGHNGLVFWMWTALLFNSASLFLFLYPKTSQNIKYVNAACVMTFIGVYIEKGFGLIIPGFVPDTLGEIYDYSPSWVEIGVTMGIWAAGALIYTMLFKFAYPIYSKNLRGVGEETV